MSRTLRTCLGAILLIALQTPANADTSTPESPVFPLTFARALAMAEAQHPELAAAQAEILAREAELGQASTRPNPTLELELENFAGSGEFSGADALESTLLLTQPIELGKKRERRRQNAETAVAQARIELAIARDELAARVSRSFFALLAAQERQRLTMEQTELARRSLAVVAERIAAGKAPATEDVRARMAVTELELALGKIDHELASARRELAMLLETGETALVASGDLAGLPRIPALADLERALDESPRQALRQNALEQRRRELALAEAQAVSDLELGLGVRHAQDSNDTALVAGISIPLPLFDRNRGDIAAARHRQARSQAEERSGALEQRAALAAAHAKLTMARAQAEALTERMLPAAEEIFAAAEYGYRAGKFPLTAVLDAQRDLLELRQRRLDALIDGHLATSELERLLGRPLSSEPAKEND